MSAPLTTQEAVREVQERAWREGWVAAQQLLPLEGRMVFAHTVIEEGMEPNPYRKELS